MIASNFSFRLCILEDLENLLSDFALSDDTNLYKFRVEKLQFNNWIRVVEQSWEHLKPRKF